ncbi:MAG: ORF6N domain-containing protein [Campylobacterota bacterium]|nr:ORF6N domain-containing protein [Campylobacterota bacterium]
MDDIIKYENIENKLVRIDGKLVLLASDVALLYDVEVKHLNRMVGKYIELFPQDYRFQLSKEQWENLKCIENTSSLNLHGGIRHRPYVYTEKGLYMIATILSKNEKAKEIHFYIIETFAKLREVSKNMKQITKITNQKEQKELVDKSNQLLQEIIDTEVVEEKELEPNVQEIKDEYEINLGFLKIKKTIINKK